MEKKPLVIFSFTKTGSRKSREIIESLSEYEGMCKGYTLPKYADKEMLNTLPSDLGQWIGARWGEAAFLFIGATGIAVRMIAPWVRDKYTDSAVLVMDEKGRYIIPLLSGHIGNAVEIAKCIASYTGAEPVLTTATDVQGKFAVDVFACKNQLYLSNRELAKAVSAAVLEGRRIGFYSAYPWEGRLPEELALCESIDEMREKWELGVAVTGETKEDLAAYKGILFLPPKNIIAGIGCRKGIWQSALEEQIRCVCKEQGIWPERIRAVASIDLKKEEKGIQEFARKYRIPFYTYTAKELQTVPLLKEGSAFVKQVTGVDNVCERAALFACPDGKILLPKQKRDKMTIALVEQAAELQF